MHSMTVPRSNPTSHIEALFLACGTTQKKAESENLYIERKNHRKRQPINNFFPPFPVPYMPYQQDVRQNGSQDRSYQPKEKDRREGRWLITM
jgi:hypothetical protein